MGKQKLNFVIVHGYTATSQSAWEPWLKSLLEEDGYAVQAPDLPNPNRPTEGKWVNYALGNIHFDENTAIISHSLGAVVAMKVAEQKKIHGLLFVAPGGLEKQFWTDDFEFDRRNGSRKQYLDGFHYQYDYEKIIKNTKKRFILGATNDAEYRKPWMEYLSDKMDAPLRMVVANDFHFCGKTEPEIWNEIASDFLSEKQGKSA